MSTLRSGAFYLDMSQVTARMNMLNQAILPSKIKAGLAGAGNRLMVDAIVKEDTVPIRRPGYGAQARMPGELRASGALFVDGVKMRTSVHYGEMAMGKYQPTIYGGTPILPFNHEACVVFNAPYAMEQHEQWPKKTQEGAGRYYLSSKLYSNATEYMAILARAIQL